MNKLSNVYVATEAASAIRRLMQEYEIEIVAFADWLTRNYSRLHGSGSFYSHAEDCPPEKKKLFTIGECLDLFRSIQIPSTI